MKLRLLGLPPTTNNLYTVVADRQVLSETGRSFHAAAAEVARRSWPGRPSRRPFAALVTLYLGGYDRDVDGSHKALIDGLSGVVWHDDRQLVLLSVRKRRAAPGVMSWASVVVRELGALPAWRKPVARRGPIGLRSDLFPPTTNNSYAVFRGRRRKTALARAVTDEYASAFARLREFSPVPRPPLRVRLRYGVTADRRDVDGSHKLIFDAARGILWPDDRVIEWFCVAKARRPAGPLVEMLISSMA
jgi:Holliday junction resolvase RusA-like endonuclease